MRVPKQEDFALLLMSELGRTYRRRLLPISEVAKRHGLSPLYLKNIVRLLRQARLVRGKEGVRGGYALTKEPATISVWDIMSAVSQRGHIDTGVAPRSVACPIYSACLPQHIKKTITGSLRRALHGVSLAHLIST